jgi:serine/threonine protein kinase
LKYLEAENKFFLAVEQDKDIETIEALQMEVDRLESFKPKSSNLILSVEQVMSKIELFIQTYNIPRAKALASNRDMNGLRAFKEVIAELKKFLEELSPMSVSFVGDNMMTKVDISSKDIMLSSNSKIVKLTERVSDGTKSSNKSIIVDAEFKGLQVKVKLRKDRNALQREYSIMESLNMKAPNYFIRPFDLVSYDKDELIPCDGCDDNLSGLHGIVMESGIIDMKAYSRMHFRKPNFLIEFKSVGFDVSEIIKTAHSNNIVLMDLKPANIVRVINNDGTNNHKAIDFDDAIDLNKFLPSTTISGTPRYIAPEVAKHMLDSTKNNKFKPTLAVDVFSFGLWVFEVFNEQVSLWTCLGVDEFKDEDVLISASKLTDDQIQRVINDKLGDTKLTAARTWLLDALKVNPHNRLTIERLNSNHSLLTTNYATISMNNLVDKIITVSNDNARQIMENNNMNARLLLNKFQELRQDVQDEFHRLGDSFSGLITQTATDNEAIAEELNYFRQQLELQRKAGRLDVDALQKTITNMGSDVSREISSSLSSILASSQGKGPLSSTTTDEVNKKLDILICMVTNVQDEVTDISKSVVNISRLTSKIAENMTRYPHTFVILPKPPMAKLGKDASRVSKAMNYFKREMFSPVMALMWNESVLIFICPISKKAVGTGYTIQIPTALLKTIVPALKWGLIFLKLALATQGLASFVPDVSVVLPEINGNYINSIEKSIIHATSETADFISNHEQDINSFLDSIGNEDDQAAFDFVADFLMKKEGYNGPNPHLWEPKNTGLVKAVSDYDQSCLWVSPECKDEFKRRGLQAIQKKTK